MVLTPLVTGSGKREQEDGAAQALRPGQETSRGGHFGGGSCGWERPVSRGIQPSPSAFSLSQALEEDASDGGWQSLGLLFREKRHHGENVVLPASRNLADTKLLHLRWNPGPLSDSSGFPRILIPTGCRVLITQ